MSALSIVVWEFLGTATLILLGVGVVATSLLPRTASDGDRASWVLIAIGWGVAVFAGASIADASSGHINPAVTLGLAIAGKVAWSQVPFYVLGQVLGGFVGAVLAWLVYKLQFDANEDNSQSVGIFATNPPIMRKPWNFVTETVATFVLVLFLLVAPYEGPALYAGAATIVLGIGASLGGPTGYAINPARDLAPRLAYTVLPIPGKGSSRWDYAWVPLLGPLVGAALAGALSRILPAVPA